MEEEIVDEDISEEEIVEDEVENVEKTLSEAQNDQISPNPSLSRGEEDASLIKEGDHEVVEDLDSSIRSEWETNSETEEIFAITSENLPFSKMKQLMTIVSWNPWDITIQVLWNEMKVSEKWLNELKKLIQE